MTGTFQSDTGGTSIPLLSAYSYIDIFSTKKCESTAKRFQIGWHIGLNLAYRKYYVGISYGSDLSKIYDGSVGVKLNAVSITTGITY